MPRKRREQVHGEPKKPTYYDDGAPHWLRAIAEEIEELGDAVPKRKRWDTPKRVYLQFSEKDAEKERMKRDFWKRKTQRTRSGR